MAVYTDIDDRELASFLAGYDIGEAIAFKGIAEGVENSNFYLETDGGRFILTLFEKRAKPEDLPFFVGVMEHLADKGFPAPHPIKDNNGQALRTLKGKYAIIVSFLKGMSPRRPSVHHCREIGAAMARMHLALADCDRTRPNDLSLPAWTAMFEANRAGAEALGTGLARDIAGDLTALERGWSRVSDLPSGIIHADLFPDNAFFLDDAFSGVIDFYFACTDALAYDLAVNINAWCFEPRGEFNITKGQALLQGYQSVRALTDGEAAALPVLARGAAMRFFLTRLHDWTNTPEDALVRPKNPMEYAEKLAFHRQASTIADYGG